MRFFKQRRFQKEYNTVKNSKLFDSDWYLKTYPDVVDDNKDPIVHYLKFGWREGRNPGPNFNTSIYTSQIPECLSKNICPLIHYETHKPKNNQLTEQSCDDIAFSVIIPTYNRCDLLQKAVYSLLAQTHENYEIIIVDDGSDDDTKEMIQKLFAEHINSNKIKYIYTTNSGVCAARNTGLQHAKNDWIAYLDSDNSVFPNFLNTFAKAIKTNSQENKIFYCMGKTMLGRIIGQDFNFKQLLIGNYIDLGTLVHHKDIFNELGGFDENMTRLVDWELIVRYTKHHKPMFIKEVCMLYNDSDDQSRITNRCDLCKNIAYAKQVFKTKNII